MALRNDKNKVIAYRFVLLKIKELIIDDRGRPRYIDYFDNVISDIFGIEHFAKKLASHRDDRDMIEILDRIGVEYLLRVTNNSKNYNALEELVMINIRIQALKKSLKKQSEKGKRNEQDLKEYKYITNLYNKGSKALRKRLGVKNRRTEYKRKYRALNDLTRNSYNSDFSDIFLKDNSYDDDDFDFNYDPYYDDDDSDDEYRDTSALEDFERQLMNRHNSKDSRPRKTEKSLSVNSIFDDYDDFKMPNMQDNDPESAYEEDMRFEGLQDQIDKLAEAIMVQSESVQALINKEQCVSLQPKRNKVMELDEYLKSYQPHTQQKPSETEILANLVPKITEDLGEIKKTQSQMGKILAHVCNWKSEMEQMMYEISQEEDKASNVTFTKPEVSGSSIYDTIDKYPDPYEMGDDEPEDHDPNLMSRSELINKINDSSDDESSEVSVNPSNYDDTPKPVMSK